MIARRHPTPIPAYVAARPGAWDRSRRATQTSRADTADRTFPDSRHERSPNSAAWFAMAGSGEAMADSWTEYQARMDGALRRARELLQRREERADGSLQGADTAMRAAFDLYLAQEREPAFMRLSHEALVGVK
jgi:hypothetical protein